MDCPLCGNKNADEYTHYECPSGSTPNDHVHFVCANGSCGNEWIEPVSI